MGSSESSERNNGDNNSTTTTDQERKDELKDSAKVAGAGAATAVYGVCSILASINNKKEEDGLMMKASGQKGVYIKRKDFEDDPASYFKGNHGNILASINNKKEEDGPKEEHGPMMKAPGQNGVYIKRKDFEDDPTGYFKGIRGNILASININGFGSSKVRIATVPVMLEDSDPSKPNKWPEIRHII